MRPRTVSLWTEVAGKQYDCTIHVHQNHLVAKVIDFPEIEVNADNWRDLQDQTNIEIQKALATPTGGENEPKRQKQGQ